MTEFDGRARRSDRRPGRAARRWRVLRADLVRVNPAPHAHRVAVRAGLAVLVPLLVLWWLDRLDLAVYATFGAFASVYGGAAARQRAGASRRRWARS